MIGLKQLNRLINQFNIRCCVADFIHLRHRDTLSSISLTKAACIIVEWYILCLGLRYTIGFGSLVFILKLTTHIFDPEHTEKTNHESAKTCYDWNSEQVFGFCIVGSVDE